MCIRDSGSPPRVRHQTAREACKTGAWDWASWDARPRFGVQMRHLAAPDGLGCVVAGLVRGRVAGQSGGRQLRKTAMDDDSRDLALTLATIAGLALALVDGFVLALPAHWADAGLVLAFLAGGLPAGFSALRALFGEGKLDIDLLLSLIHI